MGLEIYQVDAFTDRPFAGNPAAVCFLEEPRDDVWMQSLAQEMNLSETAYLLAESDGYRLRWFTPTVEVDLCGHATLASAHILWETGRLPAETDALFYTRSGLLTATRASEQSGNWITMDFPAEREARTDPPDELIEALGVRPCYVGKNRHDYLIALETEDEVRRIAPDYGCLRRLPVRGVIVTSAARSGPYDFVSRFFAPGAGIDEDPATGSAHCCLGPFWQSRLGRSELLGFQASSRGGVVRVRIAGERVLLGGQAITVLRGELV